MTKREKIQLGVAFALTIFGVVGYLTTWIQGDKNESFMGTAILGLILIQSVHLSELDRRIETLELKEEA